MLFEASRPGSFRVFCWMLISESVPNSHDKAPCWAPRVSSSAYAVNTSQSCFRISCLWGWSMFLFVDPFGTSPADMELRPGLVAECNHFSMFGFRTCMINGRCHTVFGGLSKKSTDSISQSPSLYVFDRHVPEGMPHASSH